MSGLGLPEHLAESLRSTDHRIIVTGASGWVGSATLDVLQQALGSIAFRRRIFAFASTARSLTLRNGTEVPLAALEHIADVPAGPALIFHYAFLGREKVATLSLGDYVAANTRISDIVRSTVERLRPAGMFLTSSGAVYRADRRFDEDLAANPYGVLKYRDEVRFAGTCAATGTKLVTARVFNLSGEYINKLTSYALSSFILAALAGLPIIVQATRRVERSYVYVGDVVSLALACLLGPAPAPPAFDTAGERMVEMGELAALVRDICGRPDLPILRGRFDKAEPADRYVGDGGTMRRLLGPKPEPLTALTRQIRLTSSYLAQSTARASKQPA